VSEQATAMRDNNQAKIAGKISGRSFLIGLGLFFATIFIANGIMVYYALSTFDGVETDNAYRKGRAYNHVLEAEAAQAALGWTVTVAQVPTYTATSVVLNVIVTLADSSGQALNLSPVSINFWRPTVQGMDVAASLASKGDGTYEGQLVLASAGNWIARINTMTPEGQPFVYEERVFVPPASPTPTP